MARRSIYDQAMNGFSGRGKGFGGGGRDLYPNPPDASHFGPGGDIAQGPGLDEYGIGQGYGGVGNQSYWLDQLDYLFTAPGSGGLDWGDYDINTLGGMYDWYNDIGEQQVIDQGYYGGGINSPPPTDFYDWINMWNTMGGMVDEPWQWSQNQQGNIGGAGDVGYGSYFAGGGEVWDWTAPGTAQGPPGTSPQDYDCATLGPSFNSAGECIACCGEQYAGTGFYGTGEEWDPETGEVDPENADCASLYSQAGGFDMTQLSFSEFQGLYC